jgi:hypothetical protein
MVGGFRTSHIQGRFYRRGRDSEAPDGFRWNVDLVFTLAGDTPLGEEHFHRVITQSIGERVSGSPYGGYRYAAGRDVGKAEWVRVYDLLPRLALEFERFGLYERFQRDTNKLLAAYGISWDLDETGQLVRVLPKGLRCIDSAIRSSSSILHRPEVFWPCRQRNASRSDHEMLVPMRLMQSNRRRPAQNARRDLTVFSECNKRQLLTAESYAC